MAERGSLHQSANQKGAMVFGPSLYDVPLLPFEKQLIETVNITEEEYRYFVSEAIRKGKTRPAGYELIPEVNAEVSTATLLVNLAISLVLTGVSMLLMPKPKKPQAQQRLDLEDISETRRFVASSGFDTLAELADYNTPIPIIFGLYDQNVGGMLVTPKLVWSRMFSLGTQQQAKLMFVVGEQGRADGQPFDGIEVPDLTGIFLGNNALDAIFEDTFAFYWKRNTTVSGVSRIRHSNRAYGTSATPGAGDPTTDTDVFLCPTATKDKDEGFCHAYSPANNVEFGAYAAIANGTNYRLNFTPVSIPRGTSNSGEINPTIQRIKIAGDGDRKRLLGGSVDDANKEGRYLRTARDMRMGNFFSDGNQDLEDARRNAGILGEELNGRNYSPRMGIVELNDSPITEDVYGKEVEVSVGDQIKFLISDSQIPEDFYRRTKDERGLDVDDINNQIKALQRAADDEMQLGELFSIAGTVWQVIARSRAKFDISDDGTEDQTITLKCIDTSESLLRRPKIGLVHRTKVVKPADGYVADSGAIGAGFFPLTKYAKAVVRNNRPTDVTEIGIKSRVFQTLNGLSNFMVFPSPEKLQQLDADRVQISGGVINSTIERTSCFTVFVRRAGVDASGKEFEYERLEPLFAVTGSKPVDQYSFIRFQHPVERDPSEYEFKFAPVPGAELRALPDSTYIIQLTAAATAQASTVTRSVDTAKYGRFLVTAAGKDTENHNIKLSILKKNKEFLTGGRITGGGVTAGTRPNLAIQLIALPEDALPAENHAINGRLEKTNGDNFRVVNSGGDFATGGKDGAFSYDIMTDIYGDAGRPENFGQNEITVFFKEYFGTDRWIQFRYRFEKVDLPANHHARTASQNATSKAWAIREHSIAKSSGNFSVNEVVVVKRGLGGTNVEGGDTSSYPSSNPFTRSGSGVMTFSGFKFRITEVQRFEGFQGRTQGYYYEVFGHANDFDLGETQTVKRTLTAGSKTLAIDITARVSDLGPDHWSAERKGWALTAVDVDSTNTSEGFAMEDVIDDVPSHSTDNPYTRGRDVGMRFQVKGLEQVETVPVLETAERTFEGQSQTADISFYREFVEKSNQNGPEHQVVYVNEISRNDQIPAYERMTTAGLVIKASRNFNQLDQMRVWLPKGVHVKRLHPDKTTYESDSSSSTYNQEDGPSNLFTDLVHYLMTDETAGAGPLLNMTEDNPSLLNVADLQETSKFLRANNLFFNGAIADRSNIRGLISQLAPNFLCNFLISNGKFSIKPAVPVNSDGTISTGAVPIKQLFTDGNILEDTFQLEYLSAEERQPFKAVVRYRKERQNKLPEERSIEVRLEGSDVLPIESFDLTQFCTSSEHAQLVARYFLLLRKLITHTVKFSTTVHGLDLGAGDFIKVTTTSSPYSVANNGTISSTGAVTSVSDLADGQYDVSYYKSASEQEVQEGVMTVVNGTVPDSNFHSSVFTILKRQNSQNIYMVEQLTFSQEGTVDIVASEYPCDDDERSLLAQQVVRSDLFEVYPQRSD
jgi:hypothetical protein